MGNHIGFECFFQDAFSSRCLHYISNVRFSNYYGAGQGRTTNHRGTMNRSLNNSPTVINSQDGSQVVPIQGELPHQEEPHPQKRSCVRTIQEKDSHLPGKGCAKPHVVPQGDMKEIMLPLTITMIINAKFGDFVVKRSLMDKKVARMKFYSRALCQR